MAAVRRWNIRHYVFKASFCGIVVCAVAFVVGFSVPAWRLSSGLWLDCHSGRCLSLPTSGIPVWFSAARAMECFTLVGYVLCIVLEMYQDFYKTVPSPDTRLVEILAFGAGFFGVIGVIVFAIFSPSSDWGFIVAAIANGVTVILACLLAYFRSLRGARRRLQGHSTGRPGLCPPYSQQDADQADGMTNWGGFAGVLDAPPPYSECVAEDYQANGVCQVNPGQFVAYWSAPKPEGGAPSWYGQPSFPPHPPPAYEPQPSDQSAPPPAEHSARAQSPPSSHSPPPPAAPGPSQERSPHKGQQQTSQAQLRAGFPQEQQKPSPQPKSSSNAPIPLPAYDAVQHSPTQAQSRPQAPHQRPISSSLKQQSARAADGSSPRAVVETTTSAAPPLSPSQYQSSSPQQQASLSSSQTRLLAAQSSPPSSSRSLAPSARRSQPGAHELSSSVSHKESSSPHANTHSPSKTYSQERVSAARSPGTSQSQNITSNSQSAASSAARSYALPQDRNVSPVYDDERARSRSTLPPEDLPSEQTSTQGTVTSHVPAFFVMKQGRMIPVYSEEDIQHLDENTVTLAQI